MQRLPKTFGPGKLIDADILNDLFKLAGQQVRIFENARIDKPNKISIGDFSQIDEGVHLFAGEGIQIGRHVHFAFGSSVSGGGWCAIGDYVSIGAAVRIVTGTENIESGLTNPTVPSASRSPLRASINIGDHAVVFTGAILFPGVHIGEGAVVSAGSLVHHDLKPWTIYGGHPLVPIKKREMNKVAGLAT
jgi:acetyltransferase-like isoleucine patch superfamily enzyme